MTMDNRHDEAIALAMEVEIGELVRETVTPEYRIAWARKQHRRRAHLIRHRALAKAAEIAEAA